MEYVKWLCYVCIFFLSWVLKDIFCQKFILFDILIPVPLREKFPIFKIAPLRIPISTSDISKSWLSNYPNLEVKNFTRSRSLGEENRDLFSWNYWFSFWQKLIWLTPRAQCKAKLKLPLQGLAFLITASYSLATTILVLCISISAFFFVHFIYIFIHLFCLFTFLFIFYWSSKMVY